MSAWKIKATGVTARPSLCGREVKVTVAADSYVSASQKVALAEGQTEQVTLVLEPK